MPQLVLGGGTFVDGARADDECGGGTLEMKTGVYVGRINVCP
jgi:hypothetical protein